jgi:hypothetical protein
VLVPVPLTAILSVVVGVSDDWPKMFVVMFQSLRRAKVEVERRELKEVQSVLLK